MNGEIDFKESLRRRVALLNGTSVQVLEDIKRVLTFTEGARFLCRALKKLGFKLAVISGKLFYKCWSRHVTDAALHTRWIFTLS